MKLLYKFTIILAILQFAILIVNSLGVFPVEAQFYSDAEIDENIREADSAWEATQQMFIPSTNTYLGQVSIAAFAGLIFVGGIAAIFTHSFIPVAFVFLLYIFFNMFTKSIGFMEKMFYNWDNNSMIYLALCFGVIIFTIFIITLAETPTHGRSGE